MTYINHSPLIEKYDVKERNFLKTQLGIFKTFAKSLNLTYWDDLSINLYKCVKMFGYGDLPEMKGKVCCHLQELNNVHNYFKQLFTEGKLFGNVVNRSTLPYQHFVLDFDLKHVKCNSYKNLNYGDYRNYITTMRNISVERHLMENNNNINNGLDNKYNTNYFFYEIIYYLTEILNLNWLPIYVMGKNGTFDKGFHIEIPDLIMSYHDIALLSFCCNKFIPNEKILDAQNNYSVFGCQKIIINHDDNDESITEFEKTYLPYVVFYNNNFSYDKRSSLEETFDTFDIIKHLNNKDIYGFRISTDKKFCDDDDALYKLLFNNDMNNSNNNNNEDNTIPEYMKNTSTKTVNYDISTQIISLLKSNMLTTTIINKKYLFI